MNQAGHRRPLVRDAVVRDSVVSDLVVRNAFVGNAVVANKFAIRELHYLESAVCTLAWVEVYGHKLS